MKKEEPKAQTRASKKYQDKVGLVSKSYKLKRSLVEDFKEACDRAGVSQAAQISEFMKNFIESQSKD